jgi:hypothetical protein
MEEWMMNRIRQTGRCILHSQCAVLVFGILALVLPCAANGQSRLNDRDLQNMMKNLRDDAKNFRNPFKDALRKSAIRNTSREKDARNLAATFATQTDQMWKHFKDKKKANDTLPGVIDSAGMIDKLVYSLNLGPATTSQWEKIRQELHQIATAFSVPEPYYQSALTPGSPTGTPSCAAAIGAVQAQKLADRCMQVSPATRPPCNVQNACSLITDEIRRGCSLLSASNTPNFCSEYR